MTRRPRWGSVIRGFLIAVIETAALGLAIPIGFFGAVNAPEQGIAGVTNPPSDRRLGVVLMIVAVLLPTIGPLCAWAFWRSKQALVAAGLLLAGGSILWLSVAA